MKLQSKKVQFKSKERHKKAKMNAPTSALIAIIVTLSISFLLNSCTSDIPVLQQKSIGSIKSGKVFDFNLVDYDSDVVSGENQKLTIEITNNAYLGKEENFNGIVLAKGFDPTIITFDSRKKSFTIAAPLVDGNPVKEFVDFDTSYKLNTAKEYHPDIIFETYIQYKTIQTINICVIGKNLPMEKWECSLKKQTFTSKFPIRVNAIEYSKDATKESIIFYIQLDPYYKYYDYNKINEKNIDSISREDENIIYYKVNSPSGLLEKCEGKVRAINNLAMFSCKIKRPNQEISFTTPLIVELNYGLMKRKSYQINVYSK